MTDNELLVMAAKAVGVPVYAIDDDGVWMEMGGAEVKLWNPLADDGDALRLAVKLKFDIDCFATWTIVHRSNAHDICENGEQPAATRLAITRAAAEIGRNMQ